MNEEFARLVSKETLEIVRLFPAPRETVWNYLVDPELRKKWFCAGSMGQKPGEVFSMEFDNSLLSDSIPPNAKTDPCNAAVNMEGTLTCFEPPEKLGYVWPGETEAQASHVLVELDDLGDQTRLRLTHSRLGGSDFRTDAAAGWHTHFDLFLDVVVGSARRDFWQRHLELKSVYQGYFSDSIGGVE